MLHEFGGELLSVRKQIEGTGKVFRQNIVNYDKQCIHEMKLAKNQCEVNLLDFLILLDTMLNMHTI